MDQNGEIGSKDLEKDRSNAQQQRSSVQTPVQDADSVEKVKDRSSGSHNSSLPNGVAHSSQPSTVPNGASHAQGAAIHGSKDPPALDQSWRDASTNKSLGTLIERAAQQCYYDLNKTLQAMSQVPLDARGAQVNGAGTRADEDASAGSLEKKRLLLNFANDQRDRFIKAFVLSDWSKNEHDQGKLIDLKVRSEMQDHHQSAAASAIGYLKRDMTGIKEPNPNLEGAMELLATGKASWIPDLGYIPHKRLSAKQILRTLRNMNIALATRLNLHEKLPPDFHDFNIANGRATFTVKNEFEVDIAIADEDPASPFYFIDIRLLFTPTSNVVDSRVRDYLEGRINHELATKGLQGCYNFLHNFVLTHKVNILRGQADQMMRDRYFDCIRVERLRRSFVVQYWTAFLGPKSWLEVGISSGKQRVLRSGRTANPEIAVRWFRRGVEVKDIPLDLDLQDLDIEKCLAIAVSRHIKLVMEDVQARAPDAAAAEGALSIAVRASALTMSMPLLHRPLQVRTDSTTGQWSISPPSRATAQAEQRLNANPLVDHVKVLYSLPCLVVQETVNQEAALLDWVPTSNLARQGNLADLFGDNIVRSSVFTPRAVWGEHWALAVTFSVRGDKWWVVHLEDGPKQEDGKTSRTMVDARQVNRSHDAGLEQRVSRKWLMDIEEAAVAEVAFGTLSEELTQLHIAYTFERSSSPPPGQTRAQSHGAGAVAVFIKSSDLMKSPKGKESKPWSDEIVRLTHHGTLSNSSETSPRSECVEHDLRLSLIAGSLEHLTKEATNFSDEDMTMNSSGGLALRILTPFGLPLVEQLRRRLRSVERMNSYLAILKQRNFKSTYLSLSKLTFVYNRDPELSAQLSFPVDGTSSVRLALKPACDNPHQLIRTMLEKGVDSLGDRGFQALVVILEITLPVLRQLEKLQDIDPSKRLLAVHPRSSTDYLVKYLPPLPRCSFQLRATSKREGNTKSIRWLVRLASSPVAAARDASSFQEALEEVWQSKDQYWQGMGNALIAEVSGVGSALQKIDDVVRRFEDTSWQPSVPAPNGVPANASIKLEEQTAIPDQTSMVIADKPSRANEHPNTSAKALNTTPSAAPGKADPDVIMLD